VPLFKQPELSRFLPVVANLHVFASVATGFAVYAKSAFGEIAIVPFGILMGDLAAAFEPAFELEVGRDVLVVAFSTLVVTVEPAGVAACPGVQNLHVFASVTSRFAVYAKSANGEIAIVPFGILVGNLAAAFEPASDLKNSTGILIITLSAGIVTVEPAGVGG